MHKRRNYCQHTVANANYLSRSCDLLLLYYYIIIIIIITIIIIILKAICIGLKYKKYSKRNKVCS